jgi:DNA-binding response OmpR family regulator
LMIRLIRISYYISEHKISITNKHMNQNKSHVLIIDDHDAVRLLLGLTFKKQYDVITKKDGIEGMAWLVAGNIPDLIMLDMQMPRLNGLDFLKQLKSSGVFRHVPVILVSANDNEEDIAMSFDLGIVDFISKPFNPITLKEKVKNILHKHRAAIAE